MTPAEATCMCNLGTDDEPNICGRKAEHMQWGESWMVPEEWPVCGRCADEFSDEIEHVTPERWARYLADARRVGLVKP